MTELLKSAWFKIMLACLAVLILFIAGFSLGLCVGERKASHFMNWSQNYDRMFPPGQRGGRHGGFMPPRELPDTHGAFGKILSVSGQSVVIQNPNNLEENVLVTSSTEIRIGRDRGTLQDLKPEVQAAVFGAPNGQGQIEARLIRLMGPPPPPPVAAPQNASSTK